jgi:hypothetical protein
MANPHHETYRLFHTAVLASQLEQKGSLAAACVAYHHDGVQGVLYAAFLKSTMPAPSPDAHAPHDPKQIP